MRECTREQFGGGGRAGVVGDNNRILRAGRREGVELGRETGESLPEDEVPSTRESGGKGSEENVPCFVLERSDEIWGEGFGPREPPSLGVRALPVRPGSCSPAR